MNNEKIISDILNEYRMINIPWSRNELKELMLKALQEAQKQSAEEILGFDKQGILEINKENWKHSEGIMYKEGMTNSALSPRDYSIECKHNNKIGVIQGYWIWWCSTHHQPATWCEIDKLKKENQSLKQQLSDVNKIIDDWYKRMSVRFLGKENCVFEADGDDIEELKSSLSKGDVQTQQKNRNVQAGSPVGSIPNHSEPTAEPLDADEQRNLVTSSAPKDNDICSKCGETKKEHALGKYCYDKDGKKTSNVFVASKDERSEK